MKESLKDVGVSFDDMEEMPASLEVVAESTDTEIKSPYAGQYTLGGTTL